MDNPDADADADVVAVAVAVTLWMEVPVLVVAFLLNAGDDAMGTGMDGNDESNGEDDNGSKTRRMTWEYTTKATRTMRTNCRETRVEEEEEGMDEFVQRCTARSLSVYR
jgi:hypothetical protein